jgi:hypothetical protein
VVVYHDLPGHQLATTLGRQFRIRENKEDVMGWEISIPRKGQSINTSRNRILTGKRECWRQFGRNGWFGRLISTRILKYNFNRPTYAPCFKITH